MFTILERLESIEARLAPNYRSSREKPDREKPDHIKEYVIKAYPKPLVKNLDDIHLLSYAKESAAKYLNKEHPEKSQQITKLIEENQVEINYVEDNLIEMVRKIVLEVQPKISAPIRADLDETKKRSCQSADFGKVEILRHKSQNVDKLCEHVASGALASLQVLDLDWNMIGDANMILLAGAFSNTSLPNLEHLRLGYNNIGDAGIKALANSLSNGALANLKGLYLSSNQIGDEGLKSLSTAITALANLEILNLLRNGVGDEGLTSLSNAITTKGKLMKLEEILVDNVHHPTLEAACKKRNITMKK